MIPCDDIALFRSLFKGRGDVSAANWEKKVKVGICLPTEHLGPKSMHKRQLRYLSVHDVEHLLKIHFVLSPFSFVFLIVVNEQSHIVLETSERKKQPIYLISTKASNHFPIN